MLLYRVYDLSFYLRRFKVFPNIAEMIDRKALRDDRIARTTDKIDKGVLWMSRSQKNAALSRLVPIKPI